MMKFLKELQKRIQAKQLEKLVDNAETITPAAFIPQAVREAHESYQLGSCRVTVMGSKNELRSRLINLETDNTKKRIESRERSENSWLGQPDAAVPLADSSVAQNLAEKILEARRNPLPSKPARHRGFADMGTSEDTYAPDRKKASGDSSK